MCSMSSSRPMWSKSAWRPSPKDLGCSMKKFSKSHHGTMHELNITPLLDLAFVLLVIFIITTTPMVNDLDLNLPTKTKPQKAQPQKPNFLIIEADGRIFLNGKQEELNALYQDLLYMQRNDTNTSVV